MANFPEDLQGSALTESPTPSEKSGEKFANEDLQATMMAVIRSVERNSLQTREEMPAFPTFSGKDNNVSSRDHIFKFSNHYVAFEDNPNYKLRLFRNSLVGLASPWYVLLPPNSITDWGQIEMAFHKQFYRMEPEMTINDLVDLIAIAQKALRLPLRKKFYDVQFNELQELVIAATKYEEMLLEEHQLKHSSKTSPFYKSKAAIHQVEFEGEPGESKGHRREAIDMCAVEMTTHFKPLMVKGLVQPVKDQKVVMNDDGFVPMKPQKYPRYSFDLTKVAEIYEELVQVRVIVPNNTKKLPKPEELRGKKYCKLHYTFNHSITNCVQFKD
ncbi:uncharacterized protein [Malus domestica]|uniref:uncharacterized protein n=1 Tax=Malus domestica TaxID=3750 RepID=UPI003974E3DA